MDKKITLILNLGLLVHLGGLKASEPEAIIREQPSEGGQDSNNFAGSQDSSCEKCCLAIVAGITWAAREEPEKRAFLNK